MLAGAVKLIHEGAAQRSAGDEGWWVASWSFERLSVLWHRRDTKTSSVVLNHTPCFGEIAALLWSHHG